MQTGRIPITPSPHERMPPRPSPDRYLRARVRGLKLLGKPELKPAHGRKVSCGRGVPGPRLPSNATSKMATTTNRPHSTQAPPLPSHPLPSRDQANTALALSNASAPSWHTCAVNYQSSPNPQIKLQLCKKQVVLEHALHDLIKTFNPHQAKMTKGRSVRLSMMVV